jgi:hypothetical protein
MKIKFNGIYVIILAMLDILLIFPNFLIIFMRLLLPGGERKIASENIALRNQLMTMSRGIKRSPKLTTCPWRILNLAF